MQRKTNGRRILVGFCDGFCLETKGRMRRVKQKSGYIAVVNALCMLFRQLGSICTRIGVVFLRFPTLMPTLMTPFLRGNGRRGGYSACRSRSALPISLLWLLNSILFNPPMACSWRTELFGPTLASREGPVPTNNALEDAELVAVLFGASWLGCVFLWWAA
jgi:hypothetical protein